MHEIDSSGSPSTSPLERPPAPDGMGPSRRGPFLVFGSISVALFLAAAGLRGNHDPVLASLGDISSLGACLSGVSAAIFGCVTLSRALRRRRRASRG